MWYSWKHAKGFARAMFFFATVFLVSTGLCGLNFAIVITGHGGGGYEDYFGGPVLRASGLIEILCMLGSMLGITVTGVAWMFSRNSEHSFDTHPKPPRTAPADEGSTSLDGKS